MGRQHGLVHGERPDVKVVDGCHPLHCQQTLTHLAVFQPWRCAWVDRMKKRHKVKGHDKGYIWDVARSRRAVTSPSIRTIIMSLMIVNVVHRTNKEKRKVQMGSAILYSGWTARKESKEVQPPTALWVVVVFPSQGLFGTDLEKDDEGADEHADALQQISHHVDEGRSHTGIGLLGPFSLKMFIIFNHYYYWLSLWFRIICSFKSPKSINVLWLTAFCSTSTWSWLLWLWLPLWLCPFFFSWLCPCPCELRPPWLWPWPDWWRVRAILKIGERRYCSALKTSILFISVGIMKPSGVHSHHQFKILRSFGDQCIKELWFNPEQKFTASCSLGTLLDLQKGLEKD